MKIYESISTRYYLGTPEELNTVLTMLKMQCSDNGYSEQVMARRYPMPKLTAEMYLEVGYEEPVDKYDCGLYVYDIRPLSECNFEIALKNKDIWEYEYNPMPEDIDEEEFEICK